MAVSRTTNARVLATVLAALALHGTPAHAQGNAFSAPIGGRSALMGNTGVALGIDGAAPFLNPATIVRLDDHRFAFSVNFYNFAVSRFSNWRQPGPVDATQFGNVNISGSALTSSGFGVLPSTLCLFFTLAQGSPDPDPELANLDSWRQKLAICLGSSESQGVAFSALPFNAATGLGQTAQSQSLVQSWSRLNLGPSYSVAVSRRLALGLSLHGVFTGESFILDSSSITTAVKNGGVQSSLGVAGGGGSWDVSAILGAIYSAAPYTFGLSVTLPAVHVIGSYTGTTHEEYGSAGTQNASISNGSGAFSASPPVRVALGAGAQWSKLTLEIDESLNIPSPSGFNAALNGTTSTLQGTTLTTAPFAATYSIQQHAVLNTSLGAELFVKRDLSLVAGTSFNLTSLPGLTPQLNVGNLVQERQSQITASAGVGSYSSGGTLMLGFQFGYGWGESVAANPFVTPNELAVVDTHSYSAIFILAGSTSLRSLGRAVVRIEHVITGDPDAPGTAPGGASTPGGAPPAGGMASPKGPTTPRGASSSRTIPGKATAPGKPAGPASSPAGADAPDAPEPEATFTSSVPAAAPAPAAAPKVPAHP